MMSFRVMTLPTATCWPGGRFSGTRGDAAMVVSDVRRTIIPSSRARCCRPTTRTRDGPLAFPRIKKPRITCFGRQAC